MNIIFYHAHLNADPYHPPSPDHTKTPSSRPSPGPLFLFLLPFLGEMPQKQKKAGLLELNSVILALFSLNSLIIQFYKTTLH
jgi:hypothetical protein